MSPCRSFVRTGQKKPAPDAPDHRSSQQLSRRPSRFSTAAPREVAAFVGRAHLVRRPRVLYEDDNAHPVYIRFPQKGGGFVTLEPSASQEEHGAFEKQA